MNRRIIFVVTFRVQQHRRDGNLGPLVPVEMRGPELHGSIANGDWVELPEGWNSGRRLNRLLNMTTGQVVKMGGRGSHRHPMLRFLAWMLGIIMFLFVLAIMGLVIAGFLGADLQEIFDDAKQAFGNTEN
jgi:hypothetical protein